MPSGLRSAAHVIARVMAAALAVAATLTAVAPASAVGTLSLLGTTTGVSHGCTRSPTWP